MRIPFEVLNFVKWVNWNQNKLEFNFQKQKLILNKILPINRQIFLNPNKTCFKHSPFLAEGCDSKILPKFYQLKRDFPAKINKRNLPKLE